MGMENLTGQELLLAKSQATLNLVMEQSGDAMGDFERTQDSTANRMRILAEDVKDLSASFGAMLLPVANELIAVVSDVIGWFTELDDWTKNTILVFGGLAAAIPIIISLVGALTVAFAGVAGPIGLVVAGLATLIAISGDPEVKMLGSVMESMVKQGASLGEAMDKVAEKTGKTTEEIMMIASQSEKLAPLVEKQKLEQIALNEELAIQNIKLGDTLQSLFKNLAVTAAISDSFGFLSGSVDALFDKLRDTFVEAETVALNMNTNIVASEKDKAAALVELYGTDKEKFIASTTEKGNAYEEILGREFDHAQWIRDQIYFYEKDISDKTVADLKDAADEKIRIANEKASLLIELYGTEEDGFIDSINRQADAYEEILGEQFDRTKWVADAIKEYREEKDDEYFAGALEKMNMYLSMVEEVSSSLMSIFSQVYENQLITLDNDTKNKNKKLDKEDKAERERLKNTIKDEDKLAAALKALDKKTADEKAKLDEESDKKRAEILTKQAKADKVSAIIGATMNTMKGVTAALSQGLPGLILAPIIGTLGAIQVGMIAAQPIPEFAEGGSFQTSGEQLIKVGDNAGGIEQVDITTVSDEGANNPGGFSAPIIIQVDKSGFYEGFLEVSRDGGVSICEKAVVQ